jgi:ubiquinone/menaquinone biosynthesis C-methylase UbiE
MSNVNQESYRRDEIMRSYLQDTYLFKAEQLLLQQYAAPLSAGHLLDIGIGGGRTTGNIIDRVKEYTGVDFSDRFIEEVKKKYDAPHVHIRWGDARNLDMFGDDTFDFVLFSFNGIDCVPFEDREKILGECFRVLKAGGHLFFSFHNTGALDRLYSFQFPKNPLNWLPEWKRKTKLEKVNGPKSAFKEKKHFALYDGADFFETIVVYVHPALQKEMLEATGFRDVRFYGASSASPVPTARFDTINTDWIYADCRKP